MNTIDGMSGTGEVGRVLTGPTRTMTRERMRWYCDALETTAAGDGRFHIASPTIHNDDEFARAQGLPGIIADGMISTNWISQLLVRAYGLRYLAGGELRTRFVRPIYEGEVVHTRAEVVSVAGAGDGRRLSLDVCCITDGGEDCTVGTATVPLDGGEHA
jgi:3-hydroxybutyryl-CoA dehydratase